jgi:glycosyltransferase involved in cell wall biosynthesis
MRLPFVSIIIPTVGRPDFLRQALESFADQSFAHDLYEVVVVDNGDDDLTYLVTENMAGTTDVSIRYVREKRKGVHYARHAGAEHSHGGILLYGDDDIVASSNWVESIYRCYDDDSVGAVGGKVVPRWYGPVPGWVYAVGDARNCGLLSLLDLGDGEFELPPTAQLNGCNLSVRASALKEVGGFNPDGFPKHLRQFRGDGESGLIRKLRTHGYRIIYTSRAVVEHMVPESRLTLDYAVDRLRRQGISRAFTKSREVNGSRMMLLVDSCVSGCAAVFYGLASSMVTNEVRSLAWRLRSTYLFSRSSHELAILQNTELRAFTLKESYWNG